MKKFLLVGLLSLLFPLASHAEIKLSDYVTASINSRYRFENVNDESKAKEANASTLRTRLGLQVAEFSGVSGYVEYENTALTGPVNFDNNINNKPQYPTINDQNNNELNQFYINYKAPLDSEIRLGRQEVVLDSRRFIGNSGWTQNGQTFEGIKIINNSLPYLTTTYAYLNKAIRNRGIYAQGSFYNMDTNLVNLNFKVVENQDYKLNIKPFYYSISLEEAPTFSSNTIGYRQENTKFFSKDSRLELLLETAKQNDFDNNPNSYEAGYYRMEPGFFYSNFNFNIGYKVFEGNGVTAFQTPLASQHGYHGWSDVINSIPVNGLNDKNVELVYTIPEDYKCEILKNTKLTAAYYDLDSDNNSVAYGKEYNFEVAKTINKNYAVALKYADYQSQSLFADTQKLSFTLEVKY